MPRHKKFRLTPKKPIASKSSSRNEIPLQVPLPMMVCVVCYNEFSSYTLNCLSWEAAVTKDFYVALNIPTDGQDEGSVISLPFCPECHSKVSVMFSIHQQLKSILQNFNCVRNDLAFTIVETIGKNCRKGPLDLIRQQIFERWKGLYAKAKKVSNVDIFDAQLRAEYLQPSLTVMDEWPADSKSMGYAEQFKNRQSQETTEHFGSSFSQGIGANKSKISLNDTSNVKKSKGKGKNVKGPVKSAKVSVTKKLIKSTKSKQTPEMPKLEPMGKLPSKSVNSTLRKSVSAKKVNGSIVRKTPKKSNLQKQSVSKRKQQILKKATRSSNFLFKTQGNNNLNMAMKRSPKQLADGTWKCGYCPISYEELSRLKRHESVCHPNTRPLICHLCPKGFLSIYSLRRHLQTSHEEVIDGFTKCPYCAKSFGKKYSFHHHIKNFHRGKPVPEFVSKSVSLKTTVKVPMVSPPSPEITDLVSNKSTLGAKSEEKIISIDGKRKSIVEITPTIPNKRDKPTLTLSEKENISDDENIMEARKNSDDVKDRLQIECVKEEMKDCNFTQDLTESYGCSTCEASFATESLLKSHMTIHEECALTSDEMADDAMTASKPMEPMEKQYNKRVSGNKGISCSICGKKFSKFQSLGGHMNLHRKSNGNTNNTSNVDLSENNLEEELPADS